MLTCIAGVYLAVSRPLIAALLAAVTMGIAGELAAVPANTEPSAASPERIGLGTYHIRLLDELSLLTDQILFDRMKIRPGNLPSALIQKQGFYHFIFISVEELLWLF